MIVYRRQYNHIDVFNKGKTGSDSTRAIIFGFGKLNNWKMKTTILIVLTILHLSCCAQQLKNDAKYWFPEKYVEASLKGDTSDITNLLIPVTVPSKVCKRLTNCVKGLYFASFSEDVNKLIYN